MCRKSETFIYVNEWLYIFFFHNIFSHIIWTLNIILCLRMPRFDRLIINRMIETIEFIENWNGMENNVQEIKNGNTQMCMLCVSVRTQKKSIFFAIICFFIHSIWCP